MREKIFFRQRFWVFFPNRSLWEENNKKIMKKIEKIAKELFHFSKIYVIM